MSRNIPASKRGFGYDPITRSLGIYVNGALAANYPPNLGRTYFVNNITGASTNDGLSWANAMDQPSTAITASEVYRQDRGDVTTNDYIRNAIIIQGTGTTYTNLAALPSYTDVIGLGATPYGDGAGIVCIGAAGADGVAGTSRGLYWYNMQMQAPSSYICMDLANIYRSEIDTCMFQGRITNADIGLRFNGTASGIYVHDCMCGAGGGASDVTIGLSINGTSFTMSRIENNLFNGITCAMYVVSTCVSANYTFVKQNVLGGSNCALGIDDNATTGQIFYAGNWIYAGTAATIVNDGQNRFVCNMLDYAFVQCTAS